MEKPTKYNPTCLVTGKKDNLKMYVLRDKDENMIGWIFLHESVKMAEIDADVKWNFKVHIQ